jgi:hypothetical protein
MTLEINNEQLQADINVLEQQRVSTKSAENIASCKQAVVQPPFVIPMRWREICCFPSLI